MPDLKLVNCAGCDRLLLGDSQVWQPGLPPQVRGRINGRPYCDSCLWTPRIQAGKVAVAEDDGGPGQQNAVRDMEDGQ